MHLPFTHKLIAKLDDIVGNGRINPVKKWWWDLDTDENGNIIKARKTNAKQLFFRKTPAPEKQKLGCFPSDMVPAPDSPPVEPDRKEARKRYQEALSAEQYKKEVMNRKNLE